MVYVFHLRKLFFAALLHLKIDNCESAPYGTTYLSRSHTALTPIQASEPRRDPLTIVYPNCKKYGQTIALNLNPTPDLKAFYSHTLFSSTAPLSRLFLFLAAPQII
jgi:hypothetical protein